MSYGLQTFDSSGNLILNISDVTPRLINVVSVTVPAGGSTTTATVSGAITTDLALVDNGAPATVSSSNTVVIYPNGTSSSTSTLKLFRIEL